METKKVLKWVNRAPQIYFNEETGWTIERESPGIKFAKFSQHNWYLKDQNGKIVAVRQTKAEAQERANARINKMRGF